MKKEIAYYIYCDKNIPIDLSLENYQEDLM